MLYILFKAIMFIVTATMPWWTNRLAQRFGWRIVNVPLWLPVLAAILFVVAGQLPDIHISRETNTFQEHFVGGGFYVALLFVYLKRRFALRWHWAVSLLALYALACSLGVANELFEFAVTKTGLIRIDISDTSWDLVANTTGALVGYGLLLLAKQTPEYIVK